MSHTANEEIILTLIGAPFRSSRRLVSCPTLECSSVGGFCESKGFKSNQQTKKY